jgi:hypothetical protein
LYTLVQQAQSRLVLVRRLRKSNFNDDIIIVNIDSVLTSNNLDTDVDIDLLSGVEIRQNNIAYVIFTSAPTGTAKAVSLFCI